MLRGHSLKTNTEVQTESLTYGLPSYGKTFQEASLQEPIMCMCHNSHEAVDEIKQELRPQIMELVV